MLKPRSRDSEGNREEQDANPAMEDRAEEMPARPVPQAPRGSVVDSATVMDGRYETDGDLRLEGKIAGQVICRGALTVAEQATITAAVIARSAMIQGRVEGEIRCSESLHLRETAVVKGTMQAGAMRIDEGAFIEGDIATKSVDFDVLITDQGPLKGSRRKGD